MNNRKWLTMGMAGVLAAGALAGCGGAGTTGTSSGEAGSQTAGASGTTTAGAEKTTSKSAAASGGSVKILSGVTGGKDEEEMKLFEQALSEATGLNVTIDKPASDYDKVLMQKLGAGSDYDLVYVTASQYANLVGQGVLLDITSYVKNSDILTNNIDPKEWADITIDGKVYAGFNKKEVHRVVAINNTLMKKAGLDYKSVEPTFDGYYNMLKTLKDASSDPDFYPINAVMSDAWDLQPYFAAVGAKEGVVLDENGKKYAPYAEDSAAPVWEWFKKLYDDGLLDPSSFVDKTKDMRAKMEASSQKTAVTADWAAWVGLHNTTASAAGVSTEDYEIVSLPGLQTPDGSYMLGKGSASLFAVPANAKNVEGAVKVLEYFATQEGGELLSTGIKDHDYTGTDGNYTLTDIGATHGGDHGAPFPIYKDYKPLFPYATGVEEAMSYAKYASIDMIIPNESDYKEIVGKWGIRIIKGEVSTAEGLQSMRSELVERGVTER
ncbi:MAG: extracellular solute-binding protein [Lachnospira sp.]|nr:extracellular solute-binding protein [Lachnospira sp.]